MNTIPSEIINVIAENLNLYDTIFLYFNNFDNNNNNA